MKREFGFITVGKILRELEEEGLKISRITFSNLEKKNLFMSRKSVGSWRVFTREEAEVIKTLIKENYGLIDTIGGDTGAVAEELDAKSEPQKD